MQFSLQQKAALGLLALCTPTHVAAQYTPYGSYFVLAPGDPIVTERLDPILAPGVIGSNHLHEFYGGSGLQANWDFNTAQQAICNNMGPKIDKSNYWFPALFFTNADGSYTRVKPGLEVYYHFDTADNGPRTAFPEGFKMMSGNAMLRSNDTATDFSTESIRWLCHGALTGNSPTPGNQNGDFEEPYRGQFPTGFTACPGADGFSGEIWFPFCWNGDDFDISNPTAHVSFGIHTDSSGATVTSNAQGGKCPSSHPTPLPQLFMEFHHDISAFANKFSANQNPWVLAMGDPTGYGMHADFVNGWADGLKAAIAVDPNDQTKTSCYTGESAQGAAACFDMYDAGTMASCTVTPALTEETDGPMASLPGCNPIQSGPATATVATNCAGYQAGSVASGASSPPLQTNSLASGASSVPLQTNAPVSSSGAVVNNKVAPASLATIASALPSSSAFNPSPSASASPNSPSSGSGITPSSIDVSNSQGSKETWVYQGCYTDLEPNRDDRTLPNWGSGSTSSNCASNCFSNSAGYTVAGTEYGSQCFCGTSLSSTATKVADSECNTPCSGAASELCGGSSRIQIYAKTGASLTKRTGHERHLRRHAVRHAGSLS